MEISKAFLVLVIFRIASTITIATKVDAGCKVKTGLGQALTGHSFSSFTVKDFQDCYQECKANEPKCRSMNYNGDHKRCELNNATETSHPQDLKEVPMSVYFESRHRVSAGSQRRVAGKTCQEILSREESASDGFYWLNSNDTEDPYVSFCNMTNGGDISASYDLIFLDRNTTNFVELNTSLPDLSAFTVCFWYRAWARQLVFLSYATGNMTDAIMMFLSETGLFRFLVLNKQTHSHTGTYNDRVWHQMCGKWTDSDGFVHLFVDGELQIRGDTTIHGVIPGTGKLILGQDQDTFGGAFDREQSFVGEMSHLYLWNTDLEDSVIKSLSMHCKEYPHPGYILKWSDFSTGINGNITKRDNSRCVTKQDVLL